MTPPLLLRKPKLHFDTVARPPHVTFDDGTKQCRNVPWLHYVEARWSQHERDVLEAEIGGWFVLLQGYNLGPLIRAIEEQSVRDYTATCRLAIFAPHPKVKALGGAQRPGLAPRDQRGGRETCARGGAAQRTTLTGCKMAKSAAGSRTKNTSEASIVLPAPQSGT